MVRGHRAGERHRHLLRLARRRRRERRLPERRRADERDELHRHRRLRRRARLRRDGGVAHVDARQREQRESPSPTASRRSSSSRRSRPARPAGAAFTTQPVVAARDANGNTVLDYSGTVTLSILRGGTAGATLSGCAGTLRSGVTTFAGCTIDKAGTAYVLQASDRTLSGSSSAFDVAAGAATRLVFSTQPGGGATSNTAFPTQPVVTALDAGGNTATGYAGTVTLSIASGGTAGAALSGCTGTLTRGVTTFSRLQDRQAGHGLRAARQRRHAQRRQRRPSTWRAGAATRLVFSTQPAGATGGTAFTTQPVVTAQDAAGNTATSYAGTVALSIASGGTRGRRAERLHRHAQQRRRDVRRLQDRQGRHGLRAAGERRDAERQQRRLQRDRGRGRRDSPSRRSRPARPPTTPSRPSRSSPPSTWVGTSQRATSGRSGSRSWRAPAAAPSAAAARRSAAA